MPERGEVRAVAWMPLGSELTADAAIGALNITVDNPVDFDEDGGTVDLNGLQYEYSTIDPDTGILTLASALTVAAVTGDRVNVYSGGQVAIDYIAFVSLGDGDEIEVPIPFSDRDLWPEGEYDFPVLVNVADDLESFVGVPGRTPIRDGSFINPATLPAPTIPTSDGLVPATAPTNLIVTGGIGALFVRWTPISNKDPVTYDAHVSPTSGFTPDSTTLAVSTMATSFTLRQLPTAVGVPPNQALSYDATYYVKVIPRDLDGAGPTSAEASGAMVRVTGPDVAAESITGDRIQGGTITGDLFASQVVLGSTISTGGLDDAGHLVGARVDLGPDGITTYAPDGVTPIVNFPLDPADDAFIHNAHVSMLSADIADNLTIYGTNNELAASSTLQLGSGVTSPSTPPTMATTYDTVQLNLTAVPSNGGSNQDYNLGTFPLDPAQITSICWDQVYTCWQVFQQKSTGYRLWRFNPDGSFRGTPLNSAVPWVDDFRGMQHVTGCRNGWIQQWTDGKWYAWETVTTGGSNRWGVIPNSWFLAGAPTDPIMSFDEGAQLSMLCQNDTYSNDTFQVRRFHTVPYVGGVIQNCVSDSVITSPAGIQRAGDTTGCYYGAADFGGNRYVTGSASYTRAQVWVPGTRYNGAANFAEWEFATQIKGFGWDGSNFWSVDGGGKLYKYTGWTWTTEPSTTWVGSSAYDSDATGGTHETPVGTLANRNAARRAKLTITVPATQDSGGIDDPDKWRVYWARTSGATPTASLMKLVSTIGSPTLATSVTIQADPTGAVPPGGIYGQAGAVNTFPGGNPAKILDGAGNVLVDAQGHGVLGMAGEVRMWAGSTAPVGWLFCQGQSLSRTAYPDLFAVIGTTFGAGTNSPAGTTFSLPDMNSRAPWGTGFMAVLGQTEGGVMAGVANPTADSQGRADRQSHVHAHGPGALTTSVVDLNLQTNTTNTGTANRVTQQNHSHAVTGNTANSSAVSGGVGSVPSVHAYQAFNFIIRI
jgi:microcystin-dependent protein